MALGLNEEPAAEAPQLGLSAQPTMAANYAEREASWRQLVQGGMSPQDAREAVWGGAPTADTMEEESGAASLASLPLIGARNLAEDTLMGTGRLLGYGDNELLGNVAGMLGASDAQEEAVALRYQERADRVASGEQGPVSGFVGDVVDSIAMNAPQFATTVLGGKLGNMGSRAITSRLPRAIPQAAHRAIDRGATIAGGVMMAEPQLIESGVRAATAAGLDWHDPEVWDRILLRGTAGAVLENITPLSISNRATQGAVGRAFTRSVLGNALRTGGKEAFWEGLTEAADVGLEAVLLDPRIYEHMAPEERDQMLAYAVNRYGRDAAIGFFSGAGIAAGPGAVSGVREHQMTEARQRQDLERVRQRFTDVGVDEKVLAEASRTPEGVARIKAAAEAIGRAETAAFAQKQALSSMNAKRDQRAQAKGRPLDPNRMAQSEAVTRETVQEIDRTVDDVVDKHAKAFGATAKATDVRVIRDEREKTAKDAARAQLTAAGFEPRPDMDVAEMQQAAQRVTTARAAETQAADRAAVITQPERKAEAEQELVQAVQNRREAEILTRAETMGIPVEEAAQVEEQNRGAVEAEAAAQLETQGRERAILRQTELEMPETMDPAMRMARAEQIVREFEADPSADQKGLNEKLTRLARQRRNATSEADIDRLTNEMATLETRRGLVTPAVEAARRVLQARGKPLAKTPAGVQGRPVSQMTGLGTKGPNEIAQQGSPATQGARDAAQTVQVSAQRPAGDGAATPSPANRLANIFRKPVMSETAPVDAVKPPVGAVSAPANAVTPSNDGLTTAAATDSAENWTAYRRSQIKTRDLKTEAPDLKGTKDVERHLHDFTKRTGKEAAALIAPDGTVLAMTTNDLTGAVSVPSEAKDNPDAIFTHTHTVQTPFSAADVTGMMRDMAKGVKRTVRAVLPDGQAIEMKPLVHINEEEAGSLYALVAHEAERIILMNPADHPVPDTKLSRDRIRQEALMQALEAAGIIEYSVPMTGITPAEQEIVDAAIERGRTLIDPLRVRATSGQGLAGAGKAGGDGGDAGIEDAGLSSEVAERIRKRERPTANPERTIELARGVIARELAKPRAQGQRNRFLKLIQDGVITEEVAQRGIEKAAQEIGNKRSFAIINVARTMFPHIDWKDMPRELQNVTKSNKKKGKLWKPTEEVRDHLTAADHMLNEIGNLGHGHFYIEPNFVKNKRNFVFKTGFHLASPKLEKYLDMSDAPAARFMPALDNPDDTTFVKRSATIEVKEDEEADPAEVEDGKEAITISQTGSNKFSTWAIEPARRTARILQRNTYDVDMRQVNNLTPKDLLSTKSMGQEGIKMKMVDFFLKVRDEGYVPQTDDEKKVQEQFFRRIREKLRTAELELGQFRKAVDNYRKEHGKKPIGFVYRVDDKGRIYADGRFTPQSTEGIMKTFSHKGVRLDKMATVDASASGWQVAALMARDDVVAENVNLAPGGNKKTGGKKNDLYVDILSDIKEQIKEGRG